MLGQQLPFFFLSPWLGSGFFTFYYGNSQTEGEISIMNLQAPIDPRPTRIDQPPDSNYVININDHFTELS